MSIEKMGLKQASLPQFDYWNAPDLSASASISHNSMSVDYRFYRLTQVGEGSPAGNRLAIANVLSALNASKSSFVYVLSGRPEGISLYLGVTSEGNTRSAAEILKKGFEGNFLGCDLQDVKNDAPEITQMLDETRHLGQVLGVPSLNDEAKDGEEDFQGVERLVNSLMGQVWQLIIVAKPGSDGEIRETLDAIYQLASDVSENIKKSVQISENSSRQTSETSGTSSSKTDGTSKNDTRGVNKGVNESRSTSKGENNSSRNSGSSLTKATSSGTSESVSTGSSESSTEGSSSSLTKGMTTGESIALTNERIDKRAEALLKYIDEKLTDRFLRGRAKGMYRTAIYICAKDQSTYDMLARGLVSIFQGNKAGITPLVVNKCASVPSTINELLSINQIERGDTLRESALAHSIPLSEADKLSVATWLNGEELSLIAGLPTKELPGLKIRKSVDFALNAGTSPVPNAGIAFGVVSQHGRELKNTVVNISKDELRKHVFVTGVTGAGKTTTCLKLLLEAGMPFLVIEPAKTEYRALHGSGAEVEYYCIGREDLTPFRLNPFELVSPKQRLSSHIDTLKATLAAVFPMEAAMPQIVEEAIILAYQEKGWLIHENHNIYTDNPWAAESDVWPTFSDMIQMLDRVISSKEMGKEFEEKYRGSLVARFTNLTLGTKGRMLNSRRSMDFDRLLDKKIVIELEELKDEQDKALFMGLIITRLAECVKHRHGQHPEFQHLTLIEEAHRLLSKPEPGDGGARKMGVEMFANLLAEVRKYGEGLIIADQIPNKLVPDVIKNTNIKIVHRLFAADDRNSIGDTMGLTDEQKDFLPMLQPGETIIYCGGWHAPVRLKVTEGLSTSGHSLDEEQIQKQGQEQLWKERLVLFPRLSSITALNSATSFSNFLRDAPLFWAMVIRLVQTSKTPIDWTHHRLRDQILRIERSWINSGILSEKEVRDALIRYFFDSVVDSEFKTDADKEQFKNTFARLMATLAESIESFTENRRGNDDVICNFISSVKYF